MATYSKLGYGNAANLDTAITNGKIDGKDIVITKDTSEFYYIRDDKTKQAIRPRPASRERPCKEQRYLCRSDCYDPRRRW